MIHAESVRTVDLAQHNAYFKRPLYTDYSFARIPQTIRALLTDAAPGIPFGPRADLYGRYDAVILLFVDAFGWRFFEQFGAHHPFLQRLVSEGLVCKLSSQFPSTTSAHVTTIHTGQPVGQHGVFEWFYYEPLVDAVIAPLLNSFAGDKERGTLARTGVEPKALYPTRTLYQELRAQGVESWVFQHNLYAASPYTTTVTNGATVVPYRTLPEAMVSLTQLVSQQRQPAYFFLYYDNIDTICHLYGPDSPQLHAQILTFLDVLERVLRPGLTASGKRTLLLLTADHGQTAINPKTTIYLNRSLPDIRRYLKTNRSGRLLVPAGSSRDLFLYINEPQLDEAQAYLQQHLAGRAEVHRVDELIAQHFFGMEPPTPMFMNRIGNLVVLPYAGETVWWFEANRFEQRFLASHGGLSRDEMDTLLLVESFG